MNLHAADVAIAVVLIFLVWVMGVALVGEPALVEQHIAPAHYCVDPPVTAVAVPPTPRHVVESRPPAPATAVTHCEWP